MLTAKEAWGALYFQDFVEVRKNIEIILSKLKTLIFTVQTSIIMSYSKIVGEYSVELFRDFPEILHFSNFRVISVPDFRNPNHQASQDAESKPYLHRPN